MAAQQGVATFSDVLLDTAGTYTLQASDAMDNNQAAVAPGTITVAPAAASRLAFTTQPTNVAVDATISPAVVVTIEDQFGNTVTSDNSPVNLTLTGNSGGAFTSGSATTVNAQNGIAAFNNLALSTGGNYNLVAHDTAVNLASVDSNTFQVTTATATSLAFTSVPSSAVAGQTFSVTAKLLGANDQPVEGDNSEVTLYIASGPITETINTVQAQNGVATFSGLSLTKAGNYNFRASDSTYNLTSLPSSTLTLRPATASQLSFYTPPVDASAGSTMQPVVVVIKDQYGNVESGDSSSVSLAASGPGGFAGANSVSVSAKNGEADFDYDLVLDKAGTYQIVASDSYDHLSGTSSNTFTITAASPATLQFVSQPSNAKQGQAISPSVTVEIVDAYGNPCTTNASSVTLASNPSGGIGTVTASAQDGMATFYGIVAETAGTYTLQATDRSLLGVTATSNPFNVQSSGPQWVQWGALDLYGAFQSSGGYQVATEAVEIALYPTGNESPNPLISITGSGDQVSYNDSALTLVGTVVSYIGGSLADETLFTVASGGFVMPYGSTTTSHLNGQGSQLNVANLAVTFSSLSFVAQGGSTSDAEIVLQGKASLPGVLADLGGLPFTVDITQTGWSIPNTMLPAGSFSLDGFQFGESGMSVSLDSQNDLFIQGNFQLDGLFGMGSFDANFTGDGNGITVEGSSVSVAGTISLANFSLPGGWGLRSAQLSFNTAQNDWTGSVEVDFPDIQVVDSVLGEFVVKAGQVDSISISGKTDIPLGPTGLFIVYMDGSVNDLTTGDPVYSGTVDISFLPKVYLNPLGEGDLLDLDITATWSSSEISGKAVLKLIDINDKPLASATLPEFDLQYTSQQVSFSAEVMLPIPGTNLSQFSATLSFELTPNLLIAYGTADIGYGILSGGVKLVYAPGDASQEYLDGWASINYYLGSIFNGYELDFADGVVTELSQAPAPHSAGTTIFAVSSATVGSNQAFTVTSGTPYLLLTASWTNNATNVPLEVTDPGYTTYSEASFTNNIVLIGSMGSPTSETVAIANPRPGNWTIAIPDTTNLGTVSFSAVEGEPVVNPTLNFLQTPAGSTTGRALGPLVVNIENGNGQLAINDDSPITLSVASGPGDLTGMTTVTAVNGVAQFNNVFLNTAGAYSLVASDSTDGISDVQSSSFMVLPAAPANLRMSQANGQNTLRLDGFRGDKGWCRNPGYVTGAA